MLFSAIPVVCEVTCVAKLTMTVHHQVSAWLSAAMRLLLRTVVLVQECAFGTSLAATLPLKRDAVAGTNTTISITVPLRSGTLGMKQ